MGGIRMSPELMTRRARAYLVVAAVRHLVIGSLALRDVGFSAALWTQIRSVAPMAVWGVLFVAVGAGCAVASVAQKQTIARWSLVASAGSSALWLGGFLAAWGNGEVTNGVLAAVWAALTAKDLVQCRQPLRSPFESIVRDALARGRA